MKLLLKINGDYFMWMAQNDDYLVQVNSLTIINSLLAFFKIIQNFILLQFSINQICKKIFP
ncbi:hypothetical protein A8938_1927 [Algoriphagus zhangzhouensis]|uniref:Uncharacterized protein n=1 Tax=Algoriphagus zhangzhouensis TaxID=1073327 RepID=A0A1M7Z9E4_9BACT|nr:hypothetical protein A8938_1927 [Algoriphagus zhangzhouensis]SHO61429.1 hypothetical protein SAMN04488108_1336 [Algoriphagus zhangzhouensis]